MKVISIAAIREARGVSNDARAVIASAPDDVAEHLAWVIARELNKGPCRTLVDMTEAEILALEELYGCPIKRAPVVSATTVVAVVQDQSQATATSGYTVPNVSALNAEANTQRPNTLEHSTLTEVGAASAPVESLEPRNQSTPDGTIVPVMSEGSV